MESLKLGKRPAKADPLNRNIKLAAILKALPPIPETWDYDANCNLAIPTPMFGNDAWGCCVMAGRAHQTLRFEAFEQKKVLPITDHEVLNEYWKEQGGSPHCRLFHPDGGLVALDSLKAWRKEGWRIENRLYDIHAFAEVNFKNFDEIKAAIFLLSGAQIGLRLPLSAKEQFYSNQPWEVKNGYNSKPDSWGPHLVYDADYNPQGPICITWGKKQQMTWDFLEYYCDELYGIVDNRNAFYEDNSPVDVEKLDGYLKEITK